MAIISTYISPLSLYIYIYMYVYIYIYILLSFLLLLLFLLIICIYIYDIYQTQVDQASAGEVACQGVSLQAAVSFRSLNLGKWAETLVEILKGFLRLG